MWGALLSIFLYWGVAFPINFRQLKRTGKTVYIHITSVIVTVVVPLPLTLVHIKGGLVVITTPPIVCYGRNSDYSVYTFVLPLAMTLAVMTFLLTLTFWTIFRVRRERA
jgi:hypothetical protein